MAKLPTDAELAILHVLWGRGPSTVREVHERLEGATGYTTTLKLMQIMHDKGLVGRDESQRSHVYSASVSEARMQGSLLGNLVEKAFGGSLSALVLRALSEERASPEELEQIRDLLRQVEDKKEDEQC